MEKLDMNKVLSEINKKYKCVVSPEKRKLERIPLSSPKFNYITGGGLARGRIHTLLGVESGGKTVLACYAGGQIQQQKTYPNIVVFLDMERTFDPDYAEVVGLNTQKNFIYLRPQCGEDGFDMLDKLLDTGEVGCVIWDSVAATPSRKVFDKKVGEANYGATAGLMAEGLKFINPKINDSGAVAFFLNQVRAKIGGFSAFGVQENSKVGGYSLPFYASWICKVSKAETITQGNEAIGIMIKLKNIKSKICVPFRSVGLTLNFSTGLDIESEYLDFYSSLNLVQVKGGWITNEEMGLRAHGKIEFIKWLDENPDKKQMLENEVNKIFSSQVILASMEEEDSFFEEGDESVLQNE